MDPKDNQTSPNINTLSVQVQSDRSPGLDMEKVKSIFNTISSNKTLVHDHFFETGDDSGLYYNFSFETIDLGALWKQIKHTLFEDPIIGDQIKKNIHGYVHGEPRLGRLFTSIPF